MTVVAAEAVFTVGYFPSTSARIPVLRDQGDPVGVQNEQATAGYDPHFVLNNCCGTIVLSGTNRTE
jgi:hypothetical protein